MRFRKILLLGLLVVAVSVGSALAKEGSDANGQFVRLTGAGAVFPRHYITNGLKSITLFIRTCR